MFNANGVLNQRDNLNDGTYRYYRSNNLLSNFTLYDNQFKQDARYLTGSLIYRKKFRKKGRSLGWVVAPILSMILNRTEHNPVSMNFMMTMDFWIQLP